jgi:carboxyl-terminal processing protease
MTSADSMKVDTTAVFYTVKGRRVYGGGGIIPDLFVPIDTTKATKFYIDCNRKATAVRFASAMFDKYRGSLSQIDDFDKLSAWLDGIGLEKQFLRYASEKDGLIPSEGEWEKTRDYMMPQLKALTGRFSKLEEEAFYRFYLPVDDVIQYALMNPSTIE